MKIGRLTDKQIIKALKCCMRIDGCDKCPLVEIPTVEQCRNNKNKCALDLINHLQGENKRLKQSNKNTLFVNEQVMSENAKQNAEIERLTEENEYLDMCGKQFFADYQKCEVENAELQKQVDELKASNEHLESENTRLVCEMSKLLDNGWDIMDKEAENCYDKGYQQAVEATAKEIFEKIFFYRNRNDTTNFDNILLNMAKEYGVEVE